MPTQKKSGTYNLGHDSQNHGKGIGAPTKVIDNMNKSGAGEHASQPKGTSIGVPDRGQPVPSMGAYKNANGGGIFRTRGSVLRNSGVAGAHRLGCKK